MNPYTYSGKINTCKNFNFKKLPSYDLLLLAFKRVDAARVTAEQAVQTTNATRQPAPWKLKGDSSKIRGAANMETNRPQK